MGMLATGKVTQTWRTNKKRRGVIYGQQNTVAKSRHWRSSHAKNILWHGYSGHCNRKSCTEEVDVIIGQWNMVTDHKAISISVQGTVKVERTERETLIHDRRNSGRKTWARHVRDLVLRMIYRTRMSRNGVKLEETHREVINRVIER